MSPEVQGNHADKLRLLGGLALGSRLKRLSDRFMTEAASIYAAQDLPFEPRWFPLFSLLAECGALATGQAARELRLSHAAISQIATAMTRAGLVHAGKDDSDERRTLLELTPRGLELQAALQPLWDDLRGAVEELTTAAGGDLLGSLSRLEQALDEDSLFERTQRRIRARQASAEVRIVDYEAKYKDAFCALNLEWIEAFFQVEAADRETLFDPEEKVLRPGGHILFAILNGEPVGTCALVVRAPGVFELAKMAVTKSAQGRQIGKRLMLAALDRARAANAHEVFLETNDRLTTAINLYKRVGFIQDTTPVHSPYARANVVMRMPLVSQPSV